MAVTEPVTRNRHAASHVAQRNDAGGQNQRDAGDGDQQRLQGHERGEHAQGGRHALAALKAEEDRPYMARHHAHARPAARRASRR